MLVECEEPGVRKPVQRAGVPGGRRPVRTVRFTPLGSPWWTLKRSYVHVPRVSGRVVHDAATVRGRGVPGVGYTGRVLYRGTTQPVPRIGIARAQPVPGLPTASPAGTPGPSRALRTPAGSRTPPRANMGEIQS